MSQLTDVHFEEFYEKMCRPYFRVDEKYLREDLLRIDIRKELEKLIDVGRQQLQEIAMVNSHENPAYFPAQDFNDLQYDDDFFSTLLRFMSSCAGDPNGERYVIDPDANCDQRDQMEGIQAFVFQILKEEK